MSTQEIFAKSHDDGESRASETIQMYFEILGQVAGDLALTLGAFDGVYVAGGITKRYPEMLQNSRFRNAFENTKGRTLTQVRPFLLHAVIARSAATRRSLL